MAYKDYFHFYPEFVDEFEEESAKALLEVICNYYEGLFIPYDGEERNIVRDFLMGPMFCSRVQNPHMPNDIIYLSVGNYTFWCQFVFQLAHELTHCFIYCNNRREDQKALWIEEPICEMMALYMIKLLSRDWMRLCPVLANNNPHYQESFSSYLESQSQPGNCLLSNATATQLVELNIHSQDRRGDHESEVLQMLELYDDSCLEGLIRYKDFINPGTILFDTERYRAAFPANRVVLYICNLQDTIMNRQTES